MYKKNGYLMSNFSYTQENSIDIIRLEGEMNEDTLYSLKDMISNLRQQGSTHLLIIGSDLKDLKTRDLTPLTSPIRIYRQIGGKIALAAFDSNHIQQLRRTLFYRFLNVFQTEEEARNFLKP